MPPVKNQPKNPFGPDLLSTVATAGIAVLIDRLGGSVAISQEDRDALATRYGGAVGVKIEELEPGRSYRLTLVRADPASRPVDPDRPLS